MCLIASELLGLQKSDNMLQVLTKVVSERTWVAWIGSVCSLFSKSSVKPFCGWRHSRLDSFCKEIVPLCNYYWQNPKYLKILFLGMDWGVIMRDGAQLEYCCWMTPPSSVFWSFVLPPSPESSQPRDLLDSSGWKNTEGSLSTTFVSWICLDKGLSQKKERQSSDSGVSERVWEDPSFSEQTELCCLEDDIINMNLMEPVELLFVIFCYAPLFPILYPHHSKKKKK